MINKLGQPVGEPLPDWTPPAPPMHTVIEGRYCRMEPLDAARHADALDQANRLDQDGRSWTYLPYGPFATADAHFAWVTEAAASTDPLFFAVVDKTSQQPVGVASYLRIMPASGSIEIGHLHFSPRLQRTRASTEALYLLMAEAFRLGYRRCEWKCDALNAPSRAAALRLGFVYEGIFRQATVYKGRNRDTAWYAVIDRDWPDLDTEFRRWLDPLNFTDAGGQRTSLAAREIAAKLLFRTP